MKTQFNTKPRLKAITQNGRIIGHGQQLAAQRMAAVVAAKTPIVDIYVDSRQVTRRQTLKANKAAIATAKKQTIRTRRQKKDA